jgi:hypothetical protein
MVAFIFLHPTCLAEPIALARPNHSDTPARLALLAYHRGRSAKHGPLMWPYLPRCRLGHGPAAPTRLVRQGRIQSLSAAPSLPLSHTCFFLPRSAGHAQHQNPRHRPPPARLASGASWWSPPSYPLA